MADTKQEYPKWIQNPAFPDDNTKGKVAKSAEEESAIKAGFGPRKIANQVKPEPAHVSQPDQPAKK